MSDNVLVSAKGTKLGLKGLKQRAVIIEHARSMILSDGVGNLSLRQLASNVNIKLGHLQYYFDTKEDLLIEVLVELYREDESAFHVDEPKAPFQDILMTLLKLWSSRNNVIYHSILSHYGDNPKFREMKRKIYKGFYGMLMEAIAAESSGHTKDVLMSKAQLITALLDGAMIQEHFGNVSTIKAKKSKFYREVVKTATFIAKK